MRGPEIVEQPYTSENLTQRMTSEAIEFLEKYVSTFYHNITIKILRNIKSFFSRTCFELNKWSDWIILRGIVNPVWMVCIENEGLV